MGMRLMVGMRCFPVLMPVMMSVFMIMAMFPVPMCMLMIVLMLMLVGRTFMDAEMNAFDLLPLRAIEVHVKIADLELGKLPFQSGRFDTKITQSADHHVAADAREAVEIKNFHGSKWERVLSEA